MKANIDVSKIEDEIVNPLANILYLSFDHEEYQKIEEEVVRVVQSLVKNHLIRPRLSSAGGHGKNFRTGKKSP